MASEGTLRIKVVGDVADFQNKMSGLATDLGRVGDKMAALGKTMTTLPILTAGHAIRRSATPTAVLGRPARSWAPLCMSAREFERWQEANELTGGTVRAERPCDDCPLLWRGKQLAAGRCNG